MTNGPHRLKAAFPSLVFSLLCSQFPFPACGPSLQTGFPKAPPNLPAAVEKREEDEETPRPGLWDGGLPMSAPWEGLVRFDWAVTVHSLTSRLQG